MIEPLISVIVPVYKVEPYLMRCVKSIQDQDYKKLEIVLVDDGSSDNCPKICDELAKTDSRIMVIHKENGGAGSARNCGFDDANGEYIAFMDSDDTISYDMFSTMISKINGDIDVVIGNLNFSNLKTDGNFFCGAIDSERIRKELIISKIECRILSEPGMYYNGFTTCLYKRSILNVYGIRFSSAKIAEDVLFIIKYLIHCDAAYFTGQICYYYYAREDSAIHSYKPTLIEDYCYYLDEIEKIINEIIDDEKLKKEALRIAGDSCVRREIANAATSGHSILNIKTELKRIKSQPAYEKYFTWKDILKMAGGNRIVHILLKMNFYTEVALYFKYRYGNKK